MGSLISKATSTPEQRIHRARLAAAAAILFYTKRGILLFVLGVVGLMVLGTGLVPELGKKGYANNIDENAMLPGQSSVYFSATDVRVVSLANIHNRATRAAALEKELRNAGLDAATQKVSVVRNNVTEVFYNVYGIARAPRAPGTEAVLFSAPWNCIDGEVNTNGYNYLFSIAAYVPKFSHWSKDIIFLFSDGGLIGTRAWLEAYHGAGDSFHPDVKASSIVHHGGVIEEALNLEFPDSPHNTFDAIGVYTQGLNGQQPNADIPMVVATAASSFGIPLRLHKSRSVVGEQVIEFVKNLGFGSSVLHPAENLVGLMEYMAVQAIGIPMSHHALFPKYKIEGITITGVRNPGNHYGTVDAQRICLAIESTLRSYSSLLERLHHAYWFYLMFTIYDYLPIAFYIGPIVLLSANFVFEAFILYMEGEFVLDLKQLKSTTEKNSNLLVRPVGNSSFMKFPRPLQLPIAVISICYAVCGMAYHYIWNNLDRFNQQPLLQTLFSAFSTQFLFSLFLIPALRLLLPPPPLTKGPEQWKLLKSLTYSLFGLTLLTMSSLNPSLSAMLALPLFPVAYLCARPASNVVLKGIQMVLLGVLSPAGIVALGVALAGEAATTSVVQTVGATGYWLEGWGMDVAVCGVWPLVVALQVLVGGF